MLDFSALRTFKPLIATPCHGNSLFLNYVLSAIRFQEGYFFSAGKRLDFFFRRGDSLITRARNDCVAYFLTNPNFTHLFWIDSDIGYSPEAAFRLLLSDHDVAAGVYPLKREDWPADGVPQGTTRQRFEELYARYTVNTGRLGEDVALVIDTDGFMKVREAPTGFMCIKRRVFDRLIVAYPELRYVPDWPEGSVPQGGVHYRFFDVMVDPETGRYLSEDYGFCRLWEKIGGEMYVDANSNLSHAGERVYTGDFGATLRSALPVDCRRPQGPTHPRHRTEQSQTESAVARRARRPSLKRNGIRLNRDVVMAGLVPAIHVFLCRGFKTWMPVT